MTSRLHDPNRGKPQRAGSRRWFVLVTLLGVWLLVELIAWAGLPLLTGGARDLGALARTREERALEIQEGQFNDPKLEVLHPYLGFVLDPALNSPALTANHGGVPISDFGLIDHASPVRAASEDEVIVGMFGGSFAYFFSVHGLDEALEQLARLPEYRGKKMTVVRLALGGYKQPQQLIGLSYLLALGAHFDVLINLDGFNEVALTAGQNVSSGVFPPFPRGWAGRLDGVVQGEELEAMVAIASLRAQRREWADRFSGVLGLSPVGNIAWLVRDGRLGESLQDAQLRLNEMSQASDFASSGPSVDYPDHEVMFDELAQVWHDSSLTMAQISGARGIRYVHVLQPNQHLDGSKPIGEAEAKTALEPPHYHYIVQKGYPRLREKGKQLVAAGVEFHDLTMVFEDHSEPLYVDACCHVSPRGYEIVGEALGRALVSAR